MASSELQRKNIPFFEEASSQRLHFAIQKDFSDGSLDPNFLKKLKSIFEVEVFVETGTHFGDTAKKASQIFRSVHTIELFPEFYCLAIERFKNTGNVCVYLGDSGSVLLSIFPQCRGRILFYLDGHYDGGDRSGKGGKNTPILEELAAIRAWGQTDSIILIDDVCDFQPSLYPDRIQGTCFAHYPDLANLIDAVLAINPHYLICFIPNALLIFPPNADITVSPLLSACTIERLSVISDFFSEHELLEAEQTIGCIKGDERIELERYFQAYADFEWSFGWRSFAGFWMGLIWLHEGYSSRAAQIFKQSRENSLPGWRLDAYSP
ncbi:MAG TPA: hypothetical protein VLE95_01915 [Chlamydiales bacterium]|nr:hypothetical protein [Chlamydiales bacterium]